LVASVGYFYFETQRIGAEELLFIQAGGKTTGDVLKQ
jgi:hypothetical protein